MPLLTSIPPARNVINSCICRARKERRVTSTATCVPIIRESDPFQAGSPFLLLPCGETTFGFIKPSRYHLAELRPVFVATLRFTSDIYAWLEIVNLYLIADTRDCETRCERFIRIADFWLRMVRIRGLYCNCVTRFRFVLIRDISK